MASSPEELGSRIPSTRFRLTVMDRQSFLPRRRFPREPPGRFCHHRKLQPIPEIPKLRPPFSPQRAIATASPRTTHDRGGRFASCRSFAVPIFRLGLLGPQCFKIAFQSGFGDDGTEPGGRVSVGGESLSGGIENPLPSHRRLFLALLHGHRVGFPWRGGGNVRSRWRCGIPAPRRPVRGLRAGRCCGRFGDWRKRRAGCCRWNCRWRALWWDPGHPAGSTQGSPCW